MKELFSNWYENEEYINRALIRIIAIYLLFCMVISNV